MGFEIREAYSIIESGDLSEVFLDEVSFNIFRSTYHRYLFGDVVGDKTSICQSMMNNTLTQFEASRRLIFVTLPQLVVLALAFYCAGTWENSVKGDAQAAIYILKFIFIGIAFVRLGTAISTYPLLRCCIMVESASLHVDLWQYCSKQMEKVIIKVVQDSGAQVAGNAIANPDDNGGDPTAIAMTPADQTAVDT